MQPLVKTGIDIAWHSIRRTVSVFCTLAVIAGLCYAVYISFIKPNTKARMATTTQNQKADAIINNEYTYPESRGLIDLKLWFIRISLFERQVTKKVKTQRQIPSQHNED